MISCDNNFLFRVLRCRRTSRWLAEQDRASWKSAESSCVSSSLSQAGCYASLESSWCPSWRPWPSCWRKTTPTWAASQRHNWYFHLFCSLTAIFTSSRHLWSPAGWGPGDRYHGSSMSVQYTDSAGRPSSPSGSSASYPGSTQPQEQRRAQELHPPHPCAIRQWGV